MQRAFLISLIVALAVLLGSPTVMESKSYPWLKPGAYAEYKALIVELTAPDGYRCVFSNPPYANLKWSVLDRNTSSATLKVEFTVSGEAWNASSHKLINVFINKTLILKLDLSSNTVWINNLCLGKFLFISIAQPLKGSLIKVADAWLQEVSSRTVHYGKTLPIYGKVVMITSDKLGNKRYIVWVPASIKNKGFAFSGVYDWSTGLAIQIYVKGKVFMAPKALPTYHTANGTSFAYKEIAIHPLLEVLGINMFCDFKLIDTNIIKLYD